MQIVKLVRNVARIVAYHWRGPETPTRVTPARITMFGDGEQVAA